MLRSATQKEKNGAQLQLSIRILELKGLAVMFSFHLNRGAMYIQHIYTHTVHVLDISYETFNIISSLGELNILFQRMTV